MVVIVSTGILLFAAPRETGASPCSLYVAELLNKRFEEFLIRNSDGSVSGGIGVNFNGRKVSLCRWSSNPKCELGVLSAALSQPLSNRLATFLFPENLGWRSADFKLEGNAISPVDRTSSKIGIRMARYADPESIKTIQIGAHKLSAPALVRPSADGPGAIHFYEKEAALLVAALRFRNQVDSQLWQDSSKDGSNIYSRSQFLPYLRIEIIEQTPELPFNGPKSQFEVRIEGLEWVNTLKTLSILSSWGSVSEIVKPHYEDLMRRANFDANRHDRREYITELAQQKTRLVTVDLRSQGIGEVRPAVTFAKPSLSEPSISEAFDQFSSATLHFNEPRKNNLVDGLMRGVDIYEADLDLSKSAGLLPFRLLLTVYRGMPLTLDNCAKIALRFPKTIGGEVVWQSVTLMKQHETKTLGSTKFGDIAGDVARVLVNTLLIHASDELITLSSTNDILKLRYRGSIISVKNPASSITSEIHVTISFPQQTHTSLIHTLNGFSRYGFRAEASQWLATLGRDLDIRIGDGP